MHNWVSKNRVIHNVVFISFLCVRTGNIIERTDQKEKWVRSTEISKKLGKKNGKKNYLISSSLNRFVRVSEHSCPILQFIGQIEGKNNEVDVRDATLPLSLSLSTSLNVSIHFSHSLSFSHTHSLSYYPLYLTYTHSLSTPSLTLTAT